MIKLLSIFFVGLLVLQSCYSEKVPSNANFKEMPKSNFQFFPNAGKDSDGDGVTDIYDNCPSEYGTMNNNGCPEAETSNKGTKLTTTNSEVVSKLFFAYNEDLLDNKAIQTLDALVEDMKSNPNQVYYIKGYADQSGSESYNMTLSEKRANNAKIHLISRGISLNQLRIVAYGERYANDNSEKNRKVEILKLIK